MPGRIEEDPDVFLRLMFRQLRTEAQRVSYGLTEVGDLKVEVDHHLLTSRDARPRRANVVGIVLNTEVRNAFAEIQRSAGSVLLPDRPAPQSGVEARQYVNIRRVEHDTPPVRPGRAVFAVAASLHRISLPAPSRPGISAPAASSLPDTGVARGGATQTVRPLGLDHTITLIALGQLGQTANCLAQLSIRPREWASY
jgi:hypothetical protein